MPKIFSLLLFLISFTLAKAQTYDSFADGDFKALPTWQGTDSLFKINPQKQLQSAGKTSLTPAFLSLPFVATDSLEWNCWVRLAFNPSSQNQARLYLYADSLALNQSKNAIYIQLGGSTGNTDSISLFALKNGLAWPLIKGRPATLASTNNLLKIKVQLKQQQYWQLWTDTSALNQLPILEGNAVYKLNSSEGFQGIWFKYTIGNANNLYLDDFYLGPLLIDTVPPQLIAWEIVNDSMAQLEFSEAIDTSLLACIISQRTIAKTLVQPNKIQLHFQEKLTPKQSYSLQIYKLCDKQNNCSKDTQLMLIYTIPQLHEVLFTELFPDPSPPIGLPEAEYIEIYNASQVSISLKQLKIADESKVYDFPPTPRNLEAQTFLVLCNPKDSALFTHLPNVLPISLPALSNEGKSLYLLNQFNDTLHAFSYTLDSYHDKDKAQGGYALEMLHPSRICQQNLNWKASKHLNGGTPGHKNSFWEMGPDTIAPAVNSFTFFGLNQMHLSFNEWIDTLQSSLVKCYLNGDEIKQLKISKDSLLLQSNKYMEHLKPYYLQCSGLKDCIGNASVIDTNFIFFEEQTPRFLNVLINEICFDENKQTHYPKVDFIELHNIGKYAINLMHLTLETSRNKINLAPYILHPDSYVVICKPEDALLFQPEIKTAGVSNFFNLPFNETLSLKNLEGSLIHQVNYQSNWLTDAFTQNPLAASIEMLPANNPCAHEKVWKASLSKKGSTPGKVNSNTTSYNDNTEPHLKLACMIADSSTVLSFNESIDTTNMQLIWEQTQDPARFAYFSNQLTKLVIKPTPSLIFPAQLSIISAADCAGNVLPSQLISIAPSKAATQKSLLFTEVLFNSYSNQTDFIEFYNPTPEPLSLDNLILHRKDLETATWKESVSLYGPGNCIAPSKTLALHAQPDALASNYPNHDLSAILAHTMLSLPDEGGILELRDSNATCIDSMAFSDDFHFELLVQTEGISLERLRLFPPQDGPSNWFSTANLASPGLYFEKQQVEGRSVFSANPQVFSPNLDGYNDYIEFTLQQVPITSWAKLTIIDYEGQIEYESAPQMIGQTNYAFRWTGINKFGNISRAGVYIAILETQDNTGNRNQFRCGFALAAQKP